MKISIIMWLSELLRYCLRCWVRW